ncbi:MAG TPA: MauE/DoxX family redox-associated membrane protein [Acidimicrobiales bacterium]
MDLLQVPFTAAALLLIPSGAIKAIRPDATRRALRAAGLAGPRTAVRLLGVAELATAIGVIVAGGRWWAASVGLLYAGFTLFLVVALWRRAPVRSCGCFGEAGAEPSPLHVGIDAAAVAVAALALSDPLPASLDVVRDGGADAAVLIAGALVVAAGAYLAFTRSLGTPATRSIPPPR